MAMEDFHKIRRLPPYVFEQVNRLKASGPRRAAPTSSTSAWAIPTCRRRKHIVDKLVEAVRDPRTHRYSVVARAFPACARRRPPTTPAASA